MAWKLTIDGREYVVDDLELADLMPIEKELGVPFGQWDFDSLEVLARLAHVLIKRENPDFTFEDATHLKISAINQGEAEDEAEADDAGPPESSEAPNGSSGTPSGGTATNDEATSTASDRPAVVGLP